MGLAVVRAFITTCGKIPLNVEDAIQSTPTMLCKLSRAA